MSGTYLVSVGLSALILLGIRLMSSPKTARQGNRLAAASLLMAIFFVLYSNQILSSLLLWVAIATGGSIGYLLAIRVSMIKMPQMVALLNGCGGGASALVALIEIIERSAQMDFFTRTSSQLALLVGGITLSGSLIAAAKLDLRLPQKPVVIPQAKLISLILLLTAVVLAFVAATNLAPQTVVLMSSLVITLSLVLGILFAIRVGGADMPVTISLLNACSGLAAAISGFTISEPLLVAVGAIIGASGLILTKIMCSAMNRSLISILQGNTIVCTDSQTITPTVEHRSTPGQGQSPAELIRNANSVIIVPGYGMAVAQAQMQVKKIADLLEQKGVDVKFAIHPVAGRMPGHMNVLLAEADVPYEKLYEMKEINPGFKDTDVVLVVGASDVINPAANTAEGTPIYGMPVLNVAEARHVIICNLDTKPGYSGVENALYSMSHVSLLPGNAAATLAKLASEISDPSCLENGITDAQVQTSAGVLKEARSVIIVPGYGMAVAQAQMHVKKVMDLLEQRGVDVKFAIHPVAGRMPGHMNVLLAEADVPYEKLYEMKEINPGFKDTDAVLVVGASDVINPAANTAQGTPIYGMPVLHVDQARQVIICNLDTKPGYSGVENTLYTMKHVSLLLGNASTTLENLINALQGGRSDIPT
ncbi:NAD(P)(+) transhydrogenase (Re/Si-specific) subunit beta [Dethiobacter alkaliphilus]|uniref:NAD(P)(+) transhydrogenase (Re/Si-specific) subunit beta n=1 Tax=Dethiobacter alkaliphilus TaxID=427926 RepID=UPI002226BD53|nr:NAD(P)(+) transhydrogenase (Re/Si-specific) subunit beta [Dethiobacter alkaliphilus]MCW3488543.1 NAD(P)(+) transhydrogenase (Re/Si-specific) subunit beta [Dethiobacter alkaliphilus]